MVRALFICCLLFATLAGGEPEAFFFSWQSDPLTTITVRWINPYTLPITHVEYSSDVEGPWQRIEGSAEPLGSSGYQIYNAEIRELQPNRSYHLRFDSNGKQCKFRTLPKNLDTPLRFVVGGDMYHDSVDILMETHRQAALTNPHFALIGGDIAYSSPRFRFFSEDNSRWISWLKAWTAAMVTPEGYAIPMITAIGNHEVAGRFDKTPAEASGFYTLFPTPGPQGYNAVDMGNYASFFILDSGHTHPVDGKQSEWLKYALAERRDTRYTFACYHVPAYPSIRRYEGARSQAVRDNWTPLFEQFGLTSAFEHHDHAYKRTVPIYDGHRDDQKGVVYIGDGAWGVAKPRQPRSSEPRWYIEQFHSARHFILVTLSPNQSSYQAIDSSGNILDHFERK